MGEDRKKTILVVDDTLTSRVILKKVFSRQYNVVEAENGKKALEILNNGADIAVMLLDIIMPELDGFGVLAAMQADSRLCSVPVVVMTASTDEETQIKALSSGAMDVLYKPINAYVTQKRVENLVDRMDAVRLSERNQNMERELHDAETDVVTGIYNKNAFLRRTRQYLDKHPDGSFLLMRWDIDNFKVYNDVYGTQAGDEYLRGVGDFYRRQGNSCRGLIYYARYEADHFVCLLDGTDLDTAALIAQMSEIMEKSKNRSFDYSLRAGLYRVEDTALDVTLMCDRALLALKTIKNDYGKKYAWYESSMRENIMREHEITNQMKSALQNDQFQVYFQPQFNYTRGVMTGAEALVRWVHPEKGVIPPAEFVPVFEKNGFIYELDGYIWEKTCSLIKQWKTQHVQMPPITVSVNISRKDLYQPDMVDRLCALPQKYGLEPKELHLEITESAYIDNPEQVVRVVSLLREKGFAVEMDDFGSGYSSLNTLKNVPVDMLKLDMKFLDSDGDSHKGGRILSSIVRMAHEIDLPVIAEGVETKQQADYLKSIGCHYMQGYYFSRPVTPQAFEEMLKKNVVEYYAKPFGSTGVDNAVDFMDAETQSTLLFNSFVGGAAILEYSNGNLAAVRINDRYFDVLGTDRDKYEKYQYHLLDRLDVRSRHRCLKAVKQAIESAQESECELRALPFAPNGENIWTKCRLRYLTKKADVYLLYLSIENINEQKKLERELTRSNQELENVINSIPGGVATYEVRPDGFQLVYASDGVATLTGRTPQEFKEQLATLKNGNVVHPADMEHTQKAVQAAVKNFGEVDVDYRILTKDGGYIWVNLRGRVENEGAAYPLFYATYHNLSAATELYRQILDETENILIVADLKTHELLYVNAAAAKFANRTKAEAGSMACHEYFGQNEIACGYRLAAKLQDKPLSRELDCEGRHYYSRLTRINWNGREAYINYIADRTAVWDRQKYTDEVLNNIPGGAAIFSVHDGRVTRDYLSEGAFSVLGYEKNERPLTEMDAKFSRVHPDDREKMTENIVRSVGEKKQFDMDMRIVTRDGAVRWVNLKANPIADAQGELRYFGLYTDITRRKGMEEELRIREQEYRMAAEQRGVVVFRYYLAGRIGVFNSASKPDCFPQMVRELPNYAVDNGIIMPCSIEEWQKFFAAVDSGQKSGSAAVLMNTSQEKCCWIRMRFTKVSRGGADDSAIISYEDISAEVEKQQSVQKQADTDGMTGALNHTATQRTVNELLRAADDKPLAFLLLDMDNLKLINDTYGHPQGDRALIVLAQTLKKHFRSTDIVGRIGGDEFAVILPGMNNENALTSSLKELVGELAAAKIGKNNCCTAKCSVGCTFCTPGKDDFDSAYKRADMALYSVKRSGKNSFAFYGDEMQKIYDFGHKGAE